MDHPKSPIHDAALVALARKRRDSGPSYMLLAFGILVALTLPYLLRPRARAFPAASAAAIQSPSGRLPASPP